jgi:invasion protein IalB
MRILPVLASLVLLAPAAMAQSANRAAAPRPAMIGEFQSWTAASHVEGGQKVCYAFTRARNMDGVPGRDANNVMLLVTHRSNGRDQVAARVGFNFARGAEGRLFVATGEFPMQTSGDTAFARDGRAVVAALRAGREALHRGPGPNGRGQATDTFALAGFAAAYEAISRECPVPAPPRR